MICPQCGNRRSICNYDGEEKCTVCEYTERAKTFIEPRFDPFKAHWLKKEMT